MAPFPLRERLVRLREKLERNLKPEDRARLLKQILQYYDAIQAWDACEFDLPALSRHMWPIGNGVTTGTAAHWLARPQALTSRQILAVRDYSADGEKGQYQRINGHYRAKARGDKTPPLDANEQRTADELDAMFSSFSGLTAPIRVYRGLSSESLALDAMESRKYQDAGFSSTSTNLLPAMVYAGKAKVILVIELPKGFKAVSISEVSRNPQEEEILLPRGVVFSLFDPPEGYNGFTLLHVRPV